jgi:hypothetical protein
MRELKAHQINECNKLVTVEVQDQKNAGGAPVKYSLYLRHMDHAQKFCDIKFQDGEIAKGINGITHEALLVILLDRLQELQKGQFACEENAVALTKVQEALFWLNHRTKQRQERGVEGTLFK